MYLKYERLEEKIKIMHIITGGEILIVNCGYPSSNV